MNDTQKIEARRLLTTGLNSKQVAKKLGRNVTTAQVAGVYAAMSRKKTSKNSTRTATNRTPVVAIANNRSVNAKTFINEIKNLRTSNPKVYSEVLRGIKSFKA